MFADDYYDNEDNAKIFDFLIKFLLTNECEFDFPVSKESEPEPFKVPDIAELADNLKSCLQVIILINYWAGKEKKKTYAFLPIFERKPSYSFMIVVLFRKVRVFPLTLSSYS